MTQVIEHPTRISDSTATLLDVAIVSHPENILQSGVLHVGISDHSPIYICRKISFSLNSNHNKVIKSRDYKSYLQQNFNQDLYAALSLVDWGTDEPNILWDNFKTTFNYVADIHAPTKVRKIRSRKSPWLTDAIKKNMNYRDFLKKKAIKTNSATFHNAYRSLRNNINNQIIHAKRNYYTNCIERNKNNSKQMWKNINHLINKRPKSSNIPALEINEQVFVEDSNIANLFNDYFADIGSILSS